MGKNNSKTMNIVCNVIDSEPATPLEYAICYILKTSVRIVFMTSKGLNHPNRITTSSGVICYNFESSILSLHLNQRLTKANDDIQKFERLNLNDDVLTINVKMTIEELKRLFANIGRTKLTVREISNMFS